MSAGARGMRFYQALFGADLIDRSNLPDSGSYLRERGMLSREPRGDWADVICPVHKNGHETHPSLRVSLTDGHYRCLACGVSGGDIIALHRLVTGLKFRDAVLDLGGRFHD